MNNKIKLFGKDIDLNFNETANIRYDIVISEGMKGYVIRNKVKNFSVV